MGPVRRPGIIRTPVHSRGGTEASIVKYMALIVVLFVLALVVGLVA